MKKRLTNLAKDSKYAVSGFVRFGVLHQYKNLLIVGGSNPLGSSIVSNFSDTWKVANIDFKQNENAELNVLLGENDDLSERIDSIDTQIGDFSKRFDSIICVSESTRKGSVKDQDIFKRYQQAEREQALPALLTSYLAAKYLAPNGLVLFTGGATPFQKSCPGALPYGITKDIVHSVALNLADKEDISTDATVVTILPEIDVAAQGNPESGSEVSTEIRDAKENDKIAKVVKMWADGKRRPMNGGFMLLKNIGGVLVPEYI